MVEKQASGCAWIKLSTFNGRKCKTIIRGALLVSLLSAPPGAHGSTPSCVQLTWERERSLSNTQSHNPLWRQSKCHFRFRRFHNKIPVLFLTRLKVTFKIKVSCYCESLHGFQPASSIYNTNIHSLSCNIDVYFIDPASGKLQADPGRLQHNTREERRK